MMRVAVFVALLVMPAMATDAPGWFGMSVSFHVNGEARWLRLCAVTAGGPAARAGLQAGDLLTHVNGKRIAFASARAALDHLATYRTGTRVRFRVARGTRTFDAVVTLTRR
jgi:regulator of sigma E protease